MNLIHFGIANIKCGKSEALRILSGCTVFKQYLHVYIFMYDLNYI